MKESKRTCANCGYDKCLEARAQLRKKGYALKEENIEIINGFAWRHICASWLPQSEIAKVARA